jgi:DNA-damage-inducible protein J
VQSTRKKKQSEASLKISQKNIDFVFYLGYNIQNYSKGFIMSKTQTTIRVDEENYAKAKEILNQIGLNYSQAINVFNNMIVINKGLPFELKLPNSDTLQALHELETREGKTFDNVEELFADLDS